MLQSVLCNNEEMKNIYHGFRALIGRSKGMLLHSSDPSLEFV